MARSVFSDVQRNAIGNGCVRRIVFVPRIMGITRMIKIILRDPITNQRKIRWILSKKLTGE